MTDETEKIDVYGARVHKQKNIDVDIPRNRLTVITGLSGSGKSSLAFDTIFAEGQRRYIETFSAYARNFLGGMERPDVDKITGLSPVISIEQKTTNKNPRSTVGTTTEIYDFLRLLFARAGTAYSYLSGEKMVKYTEEQIIELILNDYDGRRIMLLAPLVRTRKGHYKELFEQVRKKGYLYVRVDGKISEVVHGMKLDRYKNHDIEVVIDKLTVSRKDDKRLAQSVATAMAQAALNDGLNPADYAANYGLNLNAASGTPITVWNPATGSYVNYTVNGLYDGYINSRKTMRYSDTDWLDEISRTGFAQTYDLSLSHATDKHSTMFSLGYKKNNGILKYTDFQNISARMNSSYNINKYISVGENFTLTYSKQVDCAPMENALKMAPTVPVYEEDGKTFAGPVGGMSDRQNPAREQYDNRNNHLDYWRLFGNAYVEIKPIKGLTLRSNFGIDTYLSFINSMTPTFHSDIVNNDIAKTTLSHNNQTNWTWSNTANYNFKVADKHDITVLVGAEMSKQSVIDFSAYSEGYALEDVDYMWPNAATGAMRNTGAKVGYRLASFFGKADYNYDDLILASFTIRRDGSSRFGRDNRWGTFPAATLGFRISKLLDKDWMDDWKIRLSWGETGNQAIDNNAQFGLYVVDYGLDRVTSTAYDLYLQGSGTFPSGYRATQLANPNLKWESATQYNIGTDFTFLQGSLYGTIDGYIKDVDDMLITPAYLGALGEGGASWLNGPSLRNWGMEFSLGYRKNLACGLGLDISANADFFRNKVTYLPSTTTGSYAHTSTENLVQSGMPYGSIVGYVVTGLYQNQAEVDASGQPNARVGGLKYADLDGNGVINADDQDWIYNPVPKFSYGLNIALNYKNFDLSMFWQGVCDKDVYNNQKFQTDFWSVTDAGSNKGNRLLGAWNTNNTGSTIPMLTTSNTADEGRASSYFVENGSYLKLRTLQLGYNVPSSFLSKFKMSNARIYVSGQNLLTIKSKSLTCPDPENPDWNYPLATSVSFGLQIGF